MSTANKITWENPIPIMEIEKVYIYRSTSPIPDTGMITPYKILDDNTGVFYDMYTASNTTYYYRVGFKTDPFNIIIGEQITVTSGTVEEPAFVYTTGNDGTLKKLSPFGELQWMSTINSVSRKRSLAVDKYENIYVGGDSRIIFKYNKDGKLIFQKSYTFSDGTTESLYVDDFMNIYAGFGALSIIRKHDSNGNMSWETVSLTGYVKSIVGDDDFIYATSTGSKVYKIRKDTGVIVWETVVGSGTGNVLFLHDGFLYQGSMDNHISKLDLDGNIIWRKEIPSNIVWSITKAHDNHLYVGTNYAFIYKIDKDTGDEIFKKSLEWTPYPNLTDLDYDDNGNIYATENGYRSIVSKYSKDFDSLLWKMTLVGQPMKVRVSRPSERRTHLPVLAPENFALEVIPPLTAPTDIVLNEVIGESLNKPVNVILTPVLVY